MNYIAKVKERIEQENGSFKKITATYLVEGAISVTDVEVIVTEKYKGSTFDWEITSVTESKIEEVLSATDKADRFNA